MKKKLIVISMLVIALTLVFSTSAALAVKHETVGDRIFIEDGDPITFTAGEPFYVQHGILFWYDITERVGNEVALSKMILEVDGVEVEPDYYEYVHLNGLPDDPAKVVIKLYTFNFPEGMSGEHTLVRRYFFTCQSLWDDGFPVECHNPAELIENPYWEQSLVVTFE